MSYIVFWCGHSTDTAKSITVLLLRGCLAVLGLREAIILLVRG